MRGTSSTGRRLIRDLPTRAPHRALAGSLLGAYLLAEEDGARDYDGHNPAASWSVYALLALAAGTAVTGWLNYNAVGGEAFEEVHEALANAWLVARGPSTGSTTIRVRSASLRPLVRPGSSAPRSWQPCSASGPGPWRPEAGRCSPVPRAAAMNAHRKSVRPDSTAMTTAKTRMTTESCGYS